MRKIIATFLAVISLHAVPLLCDEPRKLDRIIVTPSRLASISFGGTRSVTVLDADALQLSNYYAIPDAIGNIGGIDIRRRGPEAVQADISIRGSTFEQNTVLIDGVKVNDPQTGHFAMDLPVSMEDIERIEILKGPASSLYGANSFGGVVHIITRKPKKAQIALLSEGGSYDYWRGYLSASFPMGIAANRFSIEESRSTGYMPETQFNILTISNLTTARTSLGVYDFLFGYTKKDFGADSFYSNLFSNEAENTDTRFFSLAGQMGVEGAELIPRLFLRRHWDKFALDSNRPGWQTNYHTNYVYGGELEARLEHRLADMACGFELTRDTIDSTSLERHARTQDGIYIEVSPHIAQALTVDALFRADYFSGFGWEYAPSISASYRIYKDLVARSAIGRAFRIPTFTDLYYNDSANAGNANLRPEASWSYEGGVDYRIRGLDCSGTFFHRDSEDTIDWIRRTPNEQWRASNIGSVHTNGFELSLLLSPKEYDKRCPVDTVFANYTALDEYNKHDYLSKYALDYLKQHISGGIEYGIYGLKNSWVLNYKKRVGDSGYITADTKFSFKVTVPGRMLFEAFLDITNIFNTDYSEQSGIPMPGMWLKAGGRIEL